VITVDTEDDNGVHAAGERRGAVRERYARFATTRSPCCDPSPGGTGGAVDAAEVSRALGYSDEELAHLPDDANLGLGCGNPTAIADLRPGETVLDLGSGAGIDCFLAARQVGEDGRVIGIDMTPEMVERARANAARVGCVNVEFRLGEIEALPVADASIDVIISNCVLNLSARKDRALAEAFRVLRPGGRLIVSDMVSEVPVPEALADDLDAVAACLPTLRGVYLEEFRNAGFRDVHITAETPYPPSYLLGDAGVRAFLAQHPETQDETERFASCLSGAHFTATKG
jgi:arsenite methyltransferase